jgi:quercetin 2,3-dioxygenase
MHLSRILSKAASAGIMSTTTVPTKATASAILQLKPLPKAGPYPTGDPYLFCVYHKDEYPPGNEAMEAPWRGNGSDFNPDNDFRMYHGQMIPGFPQHPHRGFETITATIEGLVDHADSVGNCGRYGQGDLQWMTAGGGIVHSEMFPLLNMDDYNPTRFFQIWLNLPARNKMVPPSFAMFWANAVPKYTTPDGKAKATIWAGDYYLEQEQEEEQSPDQEQAPKQVQNKPPPDSWASDPDNDVALIHITIQPGGTFIVPKAHDGTVNRSLFYIEGAAGTRVDGRSIPAKSSLILDPTVDTVTLENPASATDVAEFLWMQGKPIDEPVAQYGPFVMNTQAEIKQAFVDYQTTEFGGWPWPRDDMVFPREKGRFALLDGKESIPDEDHVDTTTTTKNEEL